MRMPLLVMSAVMTVGTASAADYPAKPIRLVVPYAVGGNADIVSRTIGPKLSGFLGQQIVVDNRPGASGNLGAEVASIAPADGYTLVIGTNTHASNMSLFKHNRYDLLKDFAPVSMLGSTPLLLVVQPNLGVNSVREVVALAKAKPGALNYGSGGNGSSAHLTTELFRTMTGTNIVHVIYKGAGGGLNDVISGQIQMMFSSVTSLLPHVNSGRLKGIAVTSRQRTNSAPAIPTVAESGVPGFESSLWNAVLVPARTDARVVQRLNADIVRTMKSPDIVDQLQRQGFDPESGSPRELVAYMKEEVSKWAKVVQASGARVE